MYQIVHQDGPTWAVLDDGQIIFTGTKAQVEDYLDWLENQPRRPPAEADSTDPPDADPGPPHAARFMQALLAPTARLF